jgi:predicted PurR-regulated permease PerM
VDAVQNAFGNVSMVMMDMLTTFANDVFASGGALLNIISMLLITPIVAFYLLKDWDHILQVCDDLLPRKNADTIRTQMHLVDLTISGFLRGQLLVCLCLALYYSVTLTVVGLPFGLLVGVATGALAIIPYVGWISSCALALLLAYMHGGEGHALLFSVAAVYLCAQAIESYFLTPKLVGERVGLHPLWLIFGMLAGGTLLGFVGVLLAVPATAVIGVLIRFAIGRYRESELYSG